MKRSEMINLMFKTHREYEGIGDKDQFKKLLDAMEEAGMQPPFIKIMEDLYNRSEGTYGFEVNEWEPE